MIALMAHSRRAKSAEFATPQWKYITRRMAAQLAHDDLRDVMHTVVDISLGSHYGSLVNAFKPGYFFWCGSPNAQDMAAAECPTESTPHSECCEPVTHIGQG